MANGKRLKALESQTKQIQITLRSMEMFSSSRRSRHVAEQEDQHRILLMNDTNSLPPAALSVGPRTLLQLWREYESGLGDNKAVKLFFTQQERGRARQIYSLRNNFWRLMETLISREHTVMSLIQSKYGADLSVTKVLRAIASDKNSSLLHVN